MSEFLHPDREILKPGEKLPHWQQGEVMQFVTFRLADSLPLTKLRVWKEEHPIWLSLHPKPWSPAQENEYHQRFTTLLEKWLDDGTGSCVFKIPASRQHLEQTLMHDHGSKAIHHAWVIMPNHVHFCSLPSPRFRIS